MLEPAEHVPHICIGEVHGSGGSVAWLMTHPGIATADLWACDADRRNMARVVLDLAGVIRLREQLGELAAAMLARFPA